MSAINKSFNCSDTLPQTGLRQYSEIRPFIPMRKTKLYAMVKAKEFPAPVRIGSMTCWRCEDVHAWLAAQGKSDHTTSNVVEV